MYFGPDLLDSVMICKYEMAQLSRIECFFISAIVKIVSLPGAVSSDSNNTCLAQRAADLDYVRLKYWPPDLNIALWDKVETL